MNRTMISGEGKGVGNQRERLDNPTRVRSVFRALAAKHCPGLVRASGDRPARFHVQDYDELSGELICCFEAGQVIAPPHLLEVEGYASVYWIPVASSRGPQSALRCRVPTTVVRARYRQGSRSPVEGLEVRYIHPLLNVPVQRRVRDVSRCGLSFWLDPAEDDAMAGLRFESIEIVRRGDVLFSCSAEVRSIIEVGKDRACGLRLDATTASDLSDWIALVDPVLHPRTLAHAHDTEALWQLFEESGYMQLSGRSDADFNSLKQTFHSASKRLMCAPGIGCQIVFPARQSKRLQATLSLLKTQNHAWLGYQMAKLPGRMIEGVSRREMLRQVHLHAYERAGSDPALRWLLGYVQDGTRFSQMVHQDFAARYASEGLSAVVRFRAMQSKTDPTAGVEHLDMFEVTEATQAALQHLHEHVAANFPSAYVDALDLHPDRFWLDALREQWSAAKFQRERALFIARDENEVLAAAVVELGSQGLHLFGLLDCTRLYPLSPRAPTAYEALIATCRRWYRDRGRQKFVLFREGDDLSLLKNFDDLGYANQTIVSVSLLGDLLEHMFEVTAPRSLGQDRAA